MEKVAREILDKIDALLEDDESRGRRVAHDLVEKLSDEMEKLARDKLELEEKMSSAGSESRERNELVEELASLLEDNAGRARMTRELIDEIIERLYGLDSEARALLERQTEG